MGGFGGFFFLATLQTVGNGSLYREIKVTVDSNPYYSSVFTVQMNKRPPSTDLSTFGFILPTKRNSVV